MNGVAYIGGGIPLQPNRTPELLNQIGDSISENRRLSILKEESDRRNKLTDMQLREQEYKLAEIDRERAYQQGFKTYSQQGDTRANPAYQQWLDSHVENVPATYQDFASGDSGTTMPNPAYAQAQKQTAYANGPMPAETINTPRDPYQSAFQYAMQSRDPAKMMAAEKMVDDLASAAIKRTGNPAAGVDVFNRITGQKFEYMGKRGENVVMKAGDSLIEVTPGAEKPKVLFSTPKDVNPAAYKSRSYEKGSQHITEESQDGGKTWSPVATAPRYKPSSGKDGPAKDFKNETAMRKEFLGLPEVKDYPTIETSSKRAVKALAEQGGKSNVAVDQSIITVFNKMLDPTSVVRESEYARTPGDLSVLSRIKGKWDKVQKGGAGLDKSEREALARMVTIFADIAGQQYNDQVDYYGGLATKYGYDPQNVVRLGGKKYQPTPVLDGARPTPKF